MSFRSATRDLPILTPREQQILLKKTGELRGAEREHMIYSLGLGSALREHEIVALNVGDVLHGGAIRSKIYLTIFKGMNKKTKRPKAAAAPRKPVTQRVHLPRSAQRKLAYYLKWKKKQGESLRPDAPLFATSQAGFGAVAGDRLSTRTIRFHFRRWQQRCGFETFYGFHALRHTALSNLYRATKNIEAVRKQARHTNIDTTQIYTHLTEDELAEAVKGLPC
jgi:integrase/recombinase XerC